ncbi:hypothetical protein V3468_14620 [Flavobacterium oreochromis]
MFKILKTHKAVSKLIVCNEIFVYQKTSGDIIFNDLIVENFIQQIEITIFNNRIYINDWEGNYFVYDQEKNLVEKGINQAFFNVNDSYIGRQYLKNDNIYESLIDKNNEFLLNIKFEKFNNENTILKSDYFLLNQNKDIICFDIINPKEKWSFSISKIVDSEVYKILGIFNNNLLLSLTNSTILKINIETGELNEHFSLKLFSNTESELIAQYNFIQLEDDKLIYYRFGQYAEYDLSLDKVTYEFDIKEKLQKENLHDNIFSFIKEDNLLYFYISGFGSFSLPTVAILDIKTQEIIWKNVLNNPNVFYKDFQKNSSNLYLLDSENVLHIFEKTT